MFENFGQSVSPGSQFVNYTKTLFVFLIDAMPDAITEAIPVHWADTKQPELPQVGEKEHSWIVLDKHFFVKHPLDYWQENQLENKIPIVFGKKICHLRRGHRDLSGHLISQFVSIYQ